MRAPQLAPAKFHSASFRLAWSPSRSSHWPARDAALDRHASHHTECRLFFLASITTDWFLVAGYHTCHRFDLIEILNAKSCIFFPQRTGRGLTTATAKTFQPASLQPRSSSGFHALHCRRWRSMRNAPSHTPLSLPPNPVTESGHGGGGGEEEGTLLFHFSLFASSRPHSRWKTRPPVTSRDRSDLGWPEAAHVMIANRLDVERLAPTPGSRAGGGRQCVAECWSPRGGSLCRLPAPSCTEPAASRKTSGCSCTRAQGSAPRRKQPHRWRSLPPSSGTRSRAADREKRRCGGDDRAGTCAGGARHAYPGRRAVELEGGMDHYKRVGKCQKRNGRERGGSEKEKQNKWSREAAVVKAGPKVGRRPEREPETKVAGRHGRHTEEDKAGATKRRQRDRSTRT